MNATILIIEDEPTINRVVSSYFKKDGFTVFTASDGFTGLELFNNNKIDIVCLDIMMPNIDGWHVAQAIRYTSSVPIIMMSALSEEEDILKGYSLKIDDYITKPFNPKILVAKVNSLLSRCLNTTPNNNIEKNAKNEEILVIPNIKMDLLRHKTYVNNEEIILSKTEYDLLRYFIENKGKICSRSLLLDKVWGYDVYVEERIVDTYVKKLRKHLKENSSYIKTVFGVGYRFEIDEKDK